LDYLLIIMYTVAMKWKIINGFSDYRVSDTGIVQSNRRGNGWADLKPCCTNGYKRVAIRRNGQSGHVRFFVHTLVMSEFVGPKPLGMCVNHKDGNPSNNCVYNLEYCTPKENIRHSISVLGNLCHGEHHHGAILTDQRVKEIHAAATKQTKNTRELAAEYGVSIQTIQAILSARLWKHLGLPAVRTKPYRLSDDDVREMHRLAANGERQADIAKRYLVHSSTVCDILAGHRRSNIFAEMNR